MKESKNGLRNRRTTSSKTTTTSALKTPSEQGSTASDAPRRTMISMVPSPGVLLWTFRFLAVLAFSFGTILRTRVLHTGEECSMTYSMMAFFPLEIVRDRNHQVSPIDESYGLYKFMDQRDPRFRDLDRKRNRNGRLGRADHCPFLRHQHVVVYIPGHWGTYDQARSLGAHGFGLTRSQEPPKVWQGVRQRILQESRPNTATDNNTATTDFFYSVYALDFGEQGGALHAKMLESQSDFLVDALKQLKEDCGLQDLSKDTTSIGGSLTVVAHSMGGTVARKALSQLPNDFISQLITLATPHANPIYAFDRSIDRFYEQWMRKMPHSRDGELTMISISGGLRDEMIDPDVTVLARPNGLTQNATSLIGRAKHIPDSDLLGMDHRAIAWCHEVLEQTKEIMWTVLTARHGGGPDPLLEVSKLLENSSNTVELSPTRSKGQQSLILERKYGILQAICMKASMVYNLPYLLALYVVVVAFHCAIIPLVQSTEQSSWFAPTLLGCIGTIVMGWKIQRRGFWTTVILTFLADTVNAGLVRILNHCFVDRGGANKGLPAKLVGKSLFRTWIMVSSVLGVVYLLILGFGNGDWKACAAKYDFGGLFGSVSYISWIVALYTALTMVGTAPIGYTKASARRQFCFEIQVIALVMMVVPFLLAGSLTLMKWERRVIVDSWWTLVSLEIPVVLWVWMKMLATHQERGAGGMEPSHSAIQIRSSLIGIAIVALCCRESGLLSQGTGFQVPWMADTILWIDIATSTFAQLIYS